MRQFSPVSGRADISFFQHFPEELASLYQTRRAVGRDGREMTATGLSSVNNLIVLRNVIFARKPRRTLEIGLAFGGSALTILGSLKNVHSSADFHHTAIDPGQAGIEFSGPEIVRRAMISQFFTHLDAPSERALPALIEQRKCFDLVYVDGSHLFEHVFVDAFYSTHLLAADGIVLFDDCTDPHVAKVLRFVKRNLSCVLEEISLREFSSHKSLLKRMANRIGYAQLRAFVKRGELPRPWNSRLINF